MNDATQQSEEDEAPRRSGRERKQVISVYAEAKRAAAIAERKKNEAASNNSRSDRGTRSRKRKQEQEDESDDKDIDKNEEDDYASSDDEDDRQSDASSSDDEDEFSDSEGDNRIVPNFCHPWEWGRKSLDAFQRSLFHSVDGDKIFWTNVWVNGGDLSLSWDARGALTKGQQALVSKQRKRSITLERIFGRNTKLSQVPYHPDMLPCYEYFAQGIQRHTSLETFKIINYHLPPSSWLRNNILPSLEKNSNLSVLELSNCSLSADDLSSVVDFIANNKTLSTLNISRNNIESEDTAKALAKALKKHPALCNVNLAYCSLAGGNAVFVRNVKNH